MSESQNRDNVEDIRPQEIYTNLVSITFSIYDFVFDFGLESPALGEEGKERFLLSRLRMSPEHAKSLKLVLESVISKYEGEFGEIKVNQSLKERLANPDPMEDEDESSNNE